MTIYIDAVMALNFLIDMMLLMLTNYLAKAKATRLRIFLGSLFASFIVPIQLYFPQSFLTTTFGKIFYSIVIIIIAFRWITFFNYLKLLMIFYFVTFAIGGGLIASYYMFEHPLTSILNDYAIRSNYGDPLSWLFVLIGFPIVAFYVKKQMDRQRIEQFFSEQLYTVNIHINKRSFQTNAYVDTGNQLIDPLTKHPVIICDAMFLQQWFTTHEWMALKEAHRKQDFSFIPENWVNKIRLVPYYGVSGKRELLMALKPEQLIIFVNDEKLVIKHVLVGIQFGTLSVDESYHCLLHPQIFSQPLQVS